MEINKPRRPFGKYLTESIRSIFRFGKNKAVIDSAIPVAGVGIDAGSEASCENVPPALVANLCKLSDDPRPKKPTPISNVNNIVDDMASSIDDKVVHGTIHPIAASDMICTNIITYGSRKGLKCGLIVPCRYHRKRNTPRRPATTPTESSVPHDNNYMRIDARLLGDLDLSSNIVASPPASPPRLPVAPAKPPSSFKHTASSSGNQSPTTTHRKQKVTVRLIDKNSQQRLRSVLDEALRDRAVRKRTLINLEGKYGPVCYYLRDTDVELKSRQTSLQVDHTFECQLIAHAVVQCPDYTEILRQYDYTTKNNLLSQQGFVVQGALKPVYDVQNNINEPELFNLKLLHPTLNTSKRFAYTNFLKHVYDVKRGEYNLRQDMERLISKYTSETDAATVTHALFNELNSVEDPYVTRLQSGLELTSMKRNGLVSDRKRVEERMMSLSESVKEVFEDMSKFE